MLPENTSSKPLVTWYFQGLKNGNIRQKWVSKVKMKNNIKKRKKNFEYGVGDVYDVEEILHSLFRPIFWCYEINCKEIFILLEMVTLVYLLFFLFLHLHICLYLFLIF